MVEVTGHRHRTRQMQALRADRLVNKRGWEIVLVIYQIMAKLMITGISSKGQCDKANAMIDDHSQVFTMSNRIVLILNVHLKSEFRAMLAIKRSLTRTN